MALPFFCVSGRSGSSEFGRTAELGDKSEARGGEEADRPTLRNAQTIYYTYR